MNGELLHMAMLTAFGNQYICDSNSNCVIFKEQYMERVQFIKKEDNRNFRLLKRLFPNNTNKILASSEKEWFRYLKENGCKSIKFIICGKKIDDHNLIAFANGVQGWYINCIFNDYSEIWVRDWQLDSKSCPTKWNIYYYGAKTKLYNPHDSTDGLDLLKKQFDSILENIGEFAMLIGCQEWKKIFDKGRKTLDCIPSNDSLLPDRYSVEAKQLIFAVRNSWVFGGMGSWNDSPPYYAHEMGKENEYKELTSLLYDTMLKCIQASVNSYVREEMI